MITKAKIKIIELIYFRNRAIHDQTRIGYVNYFYTPMTWVLLLTYFLTKTFVEVYQTGLETLCYCFVVDLETNDGSEDKPYVMSPKMFRCIQKYVATDSIKKMTDKEKRARHEKRKAAYLEEKDQDPDDDLSYESPPFQLRI